MASNLVIVESPAKAGTIGKYLGKDFQVIASMGHVRDLPASKLGVDVDKGFEPSYVIPPKARPVLKKLKLALEGKKKVYLATDLDREGEAIAWHIAAALDLAKFPKDAVKRITFDEITKEAVQHAVAHPRALNQELIDAQQARRVLDRLVGYTLSPILWKKIYKGLSAGRVQSAALRLVVEREKERDAFTAQEYWTLEALLSEQKSSPTFRAKLTHLYDKKLEDKALAAQTEVDAIVANIANADFVIKHIERKVVKRKPLPPYTTSTFQQDAVNKLGMSAKGAMRAAQSLYEDGHITYMRTDSLTIATVALDALRAFILQEYSKAYLPAQAAHYKTKSRNAQEAHEAIRPTHPEKAVVSKDATNQKVYDLIRRRTLACQMQPAELEQVGVDITAGPAQFRATGQQVLFPGFLKVWREDQDDTLLPEALREGMVLVLHELKPEQHFTEPPPRYSEATLIKALEEMGVGRPSTYAPTLSTLQDRTYVRIEQRRLIPEEAGYLVTNLLTKHFPQVVDYQFTANMEERLDEVAEGTAAYAQILGDFWNPFAKLIQEEEDKIEKVAPQVTDVLCPNCGAPMLVKRSRFGTFLGCSKYPECKTILPNEPTNQPTYLCPQCGKDLRQKKARRGNFYGCSGYPDCTFAVWKIDQLQKKMDEVELGGTPLPFKEQALARLAELPPTK